MFGSLGRFVLTERVKQMYFLLILGLFAGSVWADDVSLSKVPAAVRATIEREAKGHEIDDDIEQDNDDGQVVYEVDIEKNNGNEMKLKIAADGKILEKEEELYPEELPAVVLAAVEKSVPNLELDDIEMKINSDGKVEYKVEGENDDVKAKFKIAGDGTILDKEIDKNDDDDDDDMDDFKDVRKVFIKIRNQVKLAAIGDSSVEKGVDTRLFYGDKNKKYPIALNFGIASTGLPLHEVIVDSYLIHAPNLEWIVYGISPRMLNTYYRSEDGRGIRKSRMYKSDKSPETWQNLNTELVAARDIDDDDTKPWGLFDADDGMDAHFTDDDDKKDMIEDLERGRYRFNENRYKTLETMIQVLAKHNVNMLGFTPPIHPITKGQPCTDDDGTTREGYDLFVEKMKNLDHKYPNFYFVDIDNKGDHRFKYDEFNTFDHLNTKGAKKLTLMLNDLVKTIDSAKKPGNEMSVVQK
ncbi:MAG: hypothetical protein E4H40_00770 [Candidatus Brocadiia bacterium]|nr:MAG: hypothetical protein E4H40_00770 [Candidatus Brocadiia bacterium]